MLNKSDRVEQLSTGYYVRLSRPPGMVLAKAQTSVRLPEPPVFEDPDTGKKHSNPTDPSYIAAVNRAELEGQQRTMLAAVIYGMQLVDKDNNVVEPPDDGWEDLLFIASGVDWEAEIRDIMPRFNKDDRSYGRVRQAMFILYQAMADKSDYDLIGLMAGNMDDAEGDSVEDAAIAFRSESTGDANPPSETA